MKTAISGPVAQLIERLSYKQDVAGLIPAGTTFGSVASWIGHRSSKPICVGTLREGFAYNSYHSR